MTKRYRIVIEELHEWTTPHGQEWRRLYNDVEEALAAGVERDSKGLLSLSGYVDREGDKSHQEWVEVYKQEREDISLWPVIQAVNQTIGVGDLD